MESLFALAPEMIDAKILFVLVHVDEAHTSAWPIKKTDLQPHKDIDDRISRANNFMKDVKIDNEAFKIYVDDWTNPFAETFRSWPDRYICFDRDYTLIAKSTYGKDHDAVVDQDCVDLIKQQILAK